METISTRWYFGYALTHVCNGIISSKTRMPMKLYNASAISHYGHGTYSIWRVLLYYHEFMFLLWQKYSYIDRIMDKPTCDLKRKIWVLLYTQYMENISTRRDFGYARTYVCNGIGSTKTGIPMKLYDASVISHYGHSTYSIWRVLELTELFGPSTICSTYTVMRRN